MATAVPTTRISNTQNTDALLIGTAEFRFCSGATSRANARIMGYRDFGNIKAHQPTLDPKIITHVASVRGYRYENARRATEPKLNYKITSDEWNQENVALAFGGTLAAGYAQSASATTPGTTLDLLAFSISTPSVIGYWYPLSANEVPLQGISEVTVTSDVGGTPSVLVMGTDYVVDAELGMIRFVTVQNKVITITAVYPAVTSSGALSSKAITPLTNIVRSGFGDLIVYDQNATNRVVMRHLGFACDIVGESVGNIDGTKWEDFAIMVVVKPGIDAGTLSTREINAQT